MPTRVTRCSVSQSASAPRSALIVANLRLCTCQPPSGLGTRTQATSEAFAMSSPAARSTTVSIVMTLLLGRRLPGWPAGVGAESNRAFDSRSSRAGARYCLAVSPFPRPAHRTRRARLHAPGAPRVLRWSGRRSGCRVRGPRGRDGAAAVAVAGHRDAGGADEHDPLMGDSPTVVAEPTPEFPHPDPGVLRADPADEPPPGVIVKQVEHPRGDAVPEVVRPPPQHHVQPGQHLGQALLPGRSVGPARHLVL